jgi:hypothetical protein
MSDKHRIKISQFEPSFNQSITCCAASIELHHYIIVFYEYASASAARCNIG